MLDEIDWGSLDHAYGRATDTPAHLAALTSADPSAREAALDHLDGALLHQGFPASATAPAVRVLAGLLAFEELAPDVRLALLEFLGWVADATTSAARARQFADLVDALQQAVAESYPVVVGFLDHAEPAVRERAVYAAVSSVKTPAPAQQRPVLAARLHTRAKADTAERAWWVRRLSDLDDATEQYLTDPDPAVRVCAALAACLADNAAATETIVAALTHAADHGLDHRAPYRLGELIGAALVRVDRFERIAAPAQAIIRDADWTGFGSTWGPLLLAPFDPPCDHRGHLSRTQRDILAAAVANPRLWNPRNGSCSLVFQRAGLPFHRESCARIVAEP
ncbi:hypothetical protein [Nocardia sp. NPDC050717]|uniref:hypothetical protein n=1 Tax=Nocardia sp. NPDC050717 TaxID=3157221 RepID=UPI0033CDDF18